MSLAEIFYILGIVVFVSWILMIVGFVVMGFYMYKRFRRLEETVNQKLSPVSSLLDTMRKPSVQTLIAAGPIIGSIVKVAQSLRRKKR